MLQSILTDLTTATAIAASLWIATEFALGLASHRRPPVTVIPDLAPVPEPTSEPAPLPALDQCPFPITEAPTPVDPAPVPQSVGAMARDLTGLGIVALRKECLARGFKGAGKWRKDKCLAVLQG